MQENKNNTKLFHIFTLKSTLTKTEVRDKETFYSYITKNYIPRKVKDLVRVFISILEFG